MLPPVSQLTPAQAMYHFISGYTAKVAGTEVGVTEPQATFSPCFGGPFLVWHPEQVRRAAGREDASSTRPTSGWSTPAGAAAAYGAGKRMKLKHTRAIIDAIHGGALANADDRARSGLRLRRRRPPARACRPRSSGRATRWADRPAYDATAKKLAGLFRENFKKYEAGVSAEVKAAGAAR